MGYLTSVCLTWTAFRGSVCSVGYQMEMSQGRQNQRVAFGLWFFPLTLTRIPKQMASNAFIFSMKII